MLKPAKPIGWRLVGFYSHVVVQVVIVSDEAASISAEVRAASDACEIVITAGGVGPTLDDVTLAGVADALGKPLVRYCTPAWTAQYVGQVCTLVMSVPVSLLPIRVLYTR